ncbi:MAG: endonuclease domain-containing protein [Bauldia sp.]
MESAEDTVMPRYVVGPKHRSRARALRTNMTNAEIRLWLRIRQGALEGIRFRRQAPLGRYVVDFLSLECRLVIELDGSQHVQDDNVRADAVRSADLESRGFTVVRFSNTDVFENIDGVCEAIRLAALTKRPWSEEPDST